MIDINLKLTKKQRVLNALAGKDVDKPPVSNPTNVATVELMDYVDAPFPDACRDPQLNAKLALTGHTELGFDSIAPYFSIIQESSALGCEMQWEQKDNWPTVRMGNPIWKSVSDIKIPSGFLEHQDNVAITRSINILKEEVKDDVAILGKTMGPWTLAYHVFGVEPFLLLSIDDPEETKKILRKLKEITKDILPKEDIHQTVNTNMEELVNEIKDYDSKRKSEYSEMKKQESFRREFIGNLAHEIKTPLFTSQSYILTLLDGALEDKAVNKKYLKTASKAIERLNLIVKDLDLITN